MGTFTITSTSEQDQGISFVAAKEGIREGDYLQKVFSTVFDKYVKQMNAEKVEDIKTKYEKAPVELQISVALALKDVATEEAKEIITEK